MLPLNGRSVIGEVLTRCRQIPGVDDVVCAIPVSDDLIADVAIGYCHVFRGSPDDVLARYYGAAKAHKADVIVRITGDCPLISPELCGSVIDKLKVRKADYASNIEPRTFPQGLDCEVFTMATLRRAIDYGPDEHVTTWMRKSFGVKRVNVASPWKLEGRITLDTEDDYRVICAYFGHKPYESGLDIRAA